MKCDFDRFHVQSLKVIVSKVLHFANVCLSWISCFNIKVCMFTFRVIFIMFRDFKIYVSRCHVSFKSFWLFST
jgi:hypothetical protein